MDLEHLAQLFDRYAPALVLYARQWCESPEDAVQEAFLQLFKQAELPERVRPWLYRVVRNTAISSERQRLRRRNREATVSRSKPWFASVDEDVIAMLLPDAQSMRSWGRLQENPGLAAFAELMPGIGLAHMAEAKFSVESLPCKQSKQSACT